MQAADRAAFKELLTGAMAFYRRDLSTFALDVWWEACRPFDLEQTRKALTTHAMDPESGRFPPMPSDVVRQLQGTRTDRSLLAWGKVLEAIQRVGAYASVVFDDPLIHATVEDMGGWTKLCRGEMSELPFTQKRFCETYRAYSGRNEVPTYAAPLAGEHAAENVLAGYMPPAPVLVGDAEKARRVLEQASATRTTITQLAAPQVMMAIGQTRVPFARPAK